MFTKIFSSKPGPQRTVADSGIADDRRESLAVETPADEAAALPQEGESKLAAGRTYLETLYPDNWGSRFECMGELIVERKAGPSDVVQVYQTLNEDLEADILYVNPTVRGMSIVCGIRNLGTFIDSLPKMPGLASWALTHR